MNYIEYAKTLNCSDKVTFWLEHNLANYLEKNTENQAEIEHIIDFLVSDKAPIKMEKVSYKQAKSASEKWVLGLQKKAEKITELPEDIETVLDFKDGFKIVKLVGKNAYEREGYLMSHCVASYYGRDIEVYSLRDKDNNPHCTMEKDQQIKGKGNGSINPKYIGYVVQFLEWAGMSVRDSEMLNLGYVNIEGIEDKNAVFKDLFKDKYFFKGNEIVDKNGNPYQSISLWERFNIFDLDANLKIKWNFDIDLSIKTFLANCAKGKGEHLTGDLSAASNTGNYSAASNTGNYSAASNTGDLSAASNTGDQSAASNTGNYSAASNTGNYSAAIVTGLDCKASVTGKYSIAVSTGREGRAMGSLGSWITVVERNEDWEIICVKSAQIDGKKLKAGVYYRLVNKKFVEVIE